MRDHCVSRVGRQGREQTPHYLSLRSNESERNSCRLVFHRRHSSKMGSIGAALRRRPIGDGSKSSSANEPRRPHAIERTHKSRSHLAVHAVLDDQRIEMSFAAGGADDRLPRQCPARLVPRLSLHHPIANGLRQQLSDFLAIEGNRLVIAVQLIQLRTEIEGMDAGI